MAVSSGKFNLKFVMLLCIMVAVTEAQLSCNNVYSSLYPCLNFVMRGEVAPPTCCSGVKSLLSAAKSTADRRGVCSCLKSVASSATAAQIGRAASLPGKCGVNLPYKISPQLDCSNVK